LPKPNCTKPVIVPLFTILVVLLKIGGLISGLICRAPATARSDNAPMLPPLVRVASPPAESRMTPAAGRPKPPDPPVRPVCQPPITDPLDVMLMEAPPPVIAIIPLLNSPVVVIGPEEVTFMLPLPEAARIPTPFPPSAVMPGPV